MDLLTDRMLVHLLKTKHHAGHGNQCVPTFPSLRADTERSTRAASRGKRSRHGQSETTANLNRRLAVCQSRDDVRQDHQASGTGRMASRVWQNLRSSRQTELTETFPSHVVTVWLGNSERIAEKHDLQVLDSHFDKAVSADCMRPCMQNGDGTVGKAPHTERAGNKNAPDLQGLTASYSGSSIRRLGDEGFEPTTSTV